MMADEPPYFKSFDEQGNEIFISQIDRIEYEKLMELRRLNANMEKLTEVLRGKVR